MSGLSLSSENLGVLKDLLMSEKAHTVILNFIECLENTHQIDVDVKTAEVPVQKDKYVKSLEDQRRDTKAKTKQKRKNKQSIRLANKKYEPAVSFGYRFGEQNPHFTLTDSAKFNKAKLTQTSTSAERKFIGSLKSNDIKYEFQKICYYEDKYYIVDFFIPESKIVVEIDGRYHDDSKQQADDELRTRRLIKLCGVSKVIRFTNNELDNVEKVVGKLKEYLYEQA